MELTPSTVIRYFNELLESGEINRRDREMALKRWAQIGNGSTWITKDGKKWKFSKEAFTCDCGKGLYCPLIDQIKKEAKSAIKPVARPKVWPWTPWEEEVGPNGLPCQKCPGCGILIEERTYKPVNMVKHLEANHPELGREI